ncbi:gluconate 2-dehydrogenase subunit 3 family protein [Alsobacter sp. KACC 23698]|uniref:Gluconate 2-dehydrogenase subunit 3 family protein n=1 Tax=Alsobacter sp. KACC 23698 TaxID=3149229 RepID=A0AAU7JMC5_9HYPH
MHEGHHHEHEHEDRRRGPSQGPGGSLSRRSFLRRSSEVAFAAAVTITSAGALLNSAEAWAMEVKNLQPATMKTLILMARDIYPHDKVPDRFYAIAVKGYDEKAGKDPAFKAMIETGVAGLNAAAGPGGYSGVGWEAQRVALLRAISASPMFETVRSGLVVSLYNQPEIWPIFGYEGESYSKGGYIARGFDDIDWL